MILVMILAAIAEQKGAFPLVGILGRRACVDLSLEDSLFRV